MQIVLSATIASVITALVTILVKGVAWLITDSSSILASLADSMLDAASSTINFVAARYSLQPPDNEHRFGKGKAEDLAVLIQSVFCTVSGLVIIGLAIKRIINPVLLEHSITGIGLIVFSLFSTLALVLYQSYVINRTASKIVEVDRLHYLVDFLTNSAVIFSLILSYYWDNVLIDPIIAIAIASFMLFGSIKLLVRSLRNLMDHELDPQLRQKIIAIILSHPQVKGYHDLKTRCSGSKSLAQFHLEMDGDMTLNQAHNLSDEVEEMIHRQIKNIEIIIHQDPHGIHGKHEFLS